MSRDCRDELIGRIQTSIGNMMEAGPAAAAMEAVIRELAFYEISERETALTIHEGENEKTLKRYCACLRLDGKSEKTIKQYIMSCRRLAETIPKLYEEMGTYDVRYFLAVLKEKGLSNRSLENMRANLSAFYKWMQAEEVIEKNPCLSIKPIKYTEEIRLPFADTEIDALRGACKTKKERAFLETLLATGVRVSELCALNLKDIDFEKRTVRVPHGKGDKERVTYINGVAILHLREYLEERQPFAEPLFLNRFGERMKQGGVQAMLKTLGERAKVENVHPHRFRRTLASGLAARGMDVQDVKMILGHSNINTTMTYVHTEEMAVAMSYRKYAI